MAGQSGVPLVAVHLPRRQAAGAVAAAWDRGDAVLVLDPTAPAETTARLLERFTPSHLVDADGLRPVTGARGTASAPAGTAAVVVTSGTSGHPKGVELTVVGLEAIGTAFASALGTEPDDRALVCLPLHHVAGLAILARARVAGTSVTVHEGFDLEAVASSPRAEGTTFVSLVPTMLQRLLDAGAPIHEFRYMLIGAAPTPPDVRARAEAAGARVVDTYGLSETWGGVALDGDPIPGAEVMLADDGEVLVRGPMVMRGYRDDPTQTAAAFTADGWFKTADVGAWDERGRLRIIDRTRDIVITGGVNVSPTAVEHALMTHPLVSDVCVTGAADAEWGERVVVFVVPRLRSDVPSLEGLRAFGRERGLSDAQLPRQLLLVEAIPRTAGGKPLRRELQVLA